MRCGKTRLIEIRNFEDFSIEPAGNMTFLTGKNGAGKTNIIEAIYFASVGKSFRTSNDEELIRLDKEEGTILLDFTVRGVTHEIKIKLSRNKGKKILINETATKKRELMGMFRTVLFTPDELQLIKGAPQNRRRFIDLEISQVSPRYYEEILRYGRAVQQRNAAFKEARFHGFMADVDVWDMQIAKGASYIVKKRMETIGKINEIVSSMESLLTDEKESILIKYRKSGNQEERFDEEWYLEKLALSREEDSRFCHTSIGPHRDDLIFLMNGNDISSYGSQGQQRTAALSLKLAQIQLMREVMKESPILLLDDVLSELDSNRKTYLLESIKDTQTIITCTGLDEFISKHLPIQRMFQIKAGKIVKEN